MIGDMFNNLVGSKGVSYLECNGCKLPVVIESMRQTPFEPTYFEGYIYDGWRNDHLGKGTVKDSDTNVYIPSIKDVIFNNPATIVLWNDGTKTVVKCQGDDEYSEEVGLALCIAKKALGNKPNFNNVFRKWIPEYEIDIPANTQMNMSDYMAKLGTASSLAAEVMTKFKDALHAKKEKEETAND